VFAVRYEITHRCGHISNIDLFGPRPERERKVEWLESQQCQQCRLVEDGARAAEANAADNLPVIVGSPKQVAWAEQIRRKALDHAARVRQVDPGALAAAMKPEIIALGTEYVQTYEATMTKLRTETSARWWIDNRNTVDTMLYDACDDVLRKHKAYE
jgi:hypothetical protein